MENNTTPITFLLPAYKQNYLKASIDSILSQSYSNIKLIIVNDASPYHLEDVLKEYNDDRIQYIALDKNRGGIDLIAHWNACIDLVETPYMVMASDDDVYEPHYVEKLLILTKRHPEVNIFHCRYKVIDASGKVIALSSPNSEHESDLDFMTQRMINRRATCAQEFLIKTSALKEIGGFVNFPLGWYSDIATSFLLTKDKGIVATNELLFSSRYTYESLTGSKDNITRKLIATFLFKRWISTFLEQISYDPYNQKNNLQSDGMIILEDQISYLLSRIPFNTFLSFCFRKNHTSTLRLNTLLKSLLKRSA
ncbi:MAG: glycosyltransferase family 2 protein [Bacteroidales bacterium]